MFSVIFLLLLFYNMYDIEKKPVITQAQCMQDWAFDMSDSINKYLRVHLDVKNRYIIYASFLMDAMLLTFFSLFLLYWKTYRPIFAIVMFFVFRAFI